MKRCSVLLQHPTSVMLGLARRTVYLVSEELQIDSLDRKHKLLASLPLTLTKNEIRIVLVLDLIILVS